MSEPAAESGPTLSERRQILAEQREARLNPDAGGAGGASTATGLSAKWGPLPVWAWIGVIAVGAGLVWFLFKKSSSSTSASTASSSSETCMDSAGQQVPCSQIDYGGEIATLQTEIMDLQGASSTAPASSSSSSSSSGSTVQNLTASPSSGSVKLSWQAPGPGVWSYVITYSTGTAGKSGYAVGPELTTGNTSYTVSPLKSKTAYLFNVQAQQEGNPQLGPMTSVTATTT